MQLQALTRRFPDSAGQLHPGRLLWTGRLTPCEEAATYDVLIDHRLTGDPRVHVLRPRLDGPGSIPHTYNQTRLCLYVPGTWADHLLIAATIVPWTMEWLLFYELWAAGGGWHGGGIPPEAPHPWGPRIGGRTRLAQIRYERRTTVERRRLLQAHRMLHAGRAAVAPLNLPGRRHETGGGSPPPRQEQRAA